MQEVSREDLRKLLDSLAPADQPEARRRRGREFEEICRWFLRNEPTYRAQLKRVWMWDDWPERWGEDAGIDLVAEAFDGGLWAIQAKAYDPNYSVKKADVDTFLSESARPEFSFRLLIATTNKLARLARRTIDAQEKPVGELLLYDLERAEVSWPSSVADLRPAHVKRYDPRQHQREAIDAVVSGFESSDRGQLIMACGTGKTLVSLWVSESLSSERTLVLVPSLSLLKQTIREWLLHASREFEFLPVCSDDTVRGHDPMISQVAELGLPATGEPEEVAAFLKRSGPLVAFSTYQSSPVVAEAMAGSDLRFDLTIADEAHRCAGPASSLFTTVLDDERIPATKRLFMTATPRYFTGRVRKAGVETDFEIASMDDEARFGPVLHRLTFGAAIERDLLSNYELFIIGVDDPTCREYAERGRLVTRDGKEVTDARTLAAQIGLAKAMRDCNLRRTISFHGRVKGAKEFARSLPEVIAWMPEDERPDGEMWADHVSGAMPAGDRGRHIERLKHLKDGKRGLLANARCLAEGVDVPALDGVAFIDPKRSEVDIAQAVGRAIRKAEGKKLGTIVVPVFVDDSEDPEEAIKNSAFKPVWRVLRAMRDHDEILAAKLDMLRRELGHRPATALRPPAKIVIDMPVRISQDFIRALSIRAIEQTTESWEFWFGLLERFIEQTGNARVPQSFVTEDGYSLRTWVARQRNLHKVNKLSRERVKRLEKLKDKGWEWDLHSVSWEEGFAHLLRYVEEIGDAGVPQRSVTEDGFPLGRWVRMQRKAHKVNKLSRERVKRLEKLKDKGWEWSRRIRRRGHDVAATWEEGFAHLLRYVEETGDAGVRWDFVTEDGFRLANWVDRQRQAYRKGKLSDDQIKRLRSLPNPRMRLSDDRIKRLKRLPDWWDASDNK